MMVFRAGTDIFITRIVPGGIHYKYTIAHSLFKLVEICTGIIEHTVHFRKS